MSEIDLKTRGVRGPDKIPRKIKSNVKYDFSDVIRENPSLYSKLYYHAVLKHNIITCDCGKKLNYMSLKRHKNSKIHSRLKNQNVV
jgi:hypothetical protein